MNQSGTGEMLNVDAGDTDGDAAEWLGRQRRLSEEVAADVVAKAISLSPLAASRNDAEVSKFVSLFINQLMNE